METDELFKWTRENTIAGLPADLVAHFSIGALIGIFVFLVVGSDRRAVIAVFVISVVKELFFDLSAIWLSGAFFEPVKDIVVSTLGGVLLLYLAGEPFRMRVRRRH